MGKARGVSGGGITSNKVVHSQAPKAEPKARAMSPGAVSQFGQSLGAARAVTPLAAAPATRRRGQGLERLALGEGGRCFPLAVRGSGPVDPGQPRPEGGDILSEFGPEKSKG